MEDNKRVPQYNGPIENEKKNYSFYMRVKHAYD